jgi:hypothetical protein
MKMQISYERLVHPDHAARAMAQTRGKAGTKMTPGVWLNLLLSGHSPSRSVVYRFYCTDVPYYVHTHLVRHHVGIQFYVFSQRVFEDRGSRRQDEPVDFLFDVNAQALMALARARLCSRADNQAQALVGTIKEVLMSSEDNFDRILGEVLGPDCQTLGVCREFGGPCKTATAIRSLCKVVV